MHIIKLDKEQNAFLLMKNDIIIDTFEVEYASLEHIPIVHIGDYIGYLISKNNVKQYTIDSESL